MRQDMGELDSKLMDYIGKQNVARFAKEAKEEELVAEVKKATSDIGLLRERYDKEVNEFLEKWAQNQRLDNAYKFDELERLGKQYQTDLEQLKTQLGTLEGQVNAVDNSRKDSVSRTELEEKVKQAHDQLNEFKARLNWKFAKQSLFRQATTEGNKRREERLKELEAKFAKLKGREDGGAILYKQAEENRAALEKKVTELETTVETLIAEIQEARQQDEDEATAKVEALAEKIAEKAQEDLSETRRQIEFLRRSVETLAENSAKLARQRLERLEERLEEITPSRDAKVAPGRSVRI